MEGGLSQHSSKVDFLLGTFGDLGYCPWLPSTGTDTEHRMWDKPFWNVFIANQLQCLAFVSAELMEGMQLVPTSAWGDADASGALVPSSRC